MGFSSARNLGRDISAGFSPPRRMPISEAVKKFMRVPKGAGNSVPWDPELTPYIIEPMNCLASREYDAVIFVGPARTGKTIGLIDGWIVYTIVCDPSDMLVVQMTEDKAREHSKKRLDRTFRSSAAVKKRMSPRRNDNNVHDKTFRDGSFLKIGWPSVNIRRLSTPTGDCLIFLVPAWSNEKVNCLSSGQSQFLPAVFRMALISLWRQWMCRRDVIAVLWFR